MLAKIIGNDEFINDEFLNSVLSVCRSPDFANEANAADRENRQSAKNIGLLRDIGVVREVIPFTAGGGDMGAGKIMRMMEIIAAYDGGTATVINMNSTSLIALSTMPRFSGLAAALSDSLENGAMWCGGASAPSNVLDTTKAGFQFTDVGECYIVDGRGGFCTGSETAKYYFFFGRNSDPAKKEAIIALTLLDADGLDNKRNWDALGLRATGSHDFEVKDLRIPKDNVLAIPLEVMARISAETPQDIKHLRIRPLAGIVGCQLGSARRALRALIGHLEKRVGTIAIPVDGADSITTVHSKNVWARHRLGRLTALLDNAQVVAHKFADDLELQGDQGAATQYAFTRVLVATKMMMEEFQSGITALAGAHGYVAASPLNIALRDLIGFNAMVWRLDELMVNCGSAALGETISVPGLGGT